MKLKVEVANAKDKSIDRTLYLPMSDDDLANEFLFIGVDDPSNEDEYVILDIGINSQVRPEEIGVNYWMSIHELNEIAGKLSKWDGENDKLQGAITLNPNGDVLAKSPKEYIYIPGISYAVIGRHFANKYYKDLFTDNALLDQFFDFEAYGERLAERVPFAATEHGWVAKL